ncbi:MAG: MauE/DoxX family redox-associated membrane protein [Nitrospiraceae bacterium]
MLLRWSLRFFIGGIFLASAVGKALDLSGFIEVLRTYKAWPDAALVPVAVTVIGIEFAVGLWLLSGWRLRTVALVAAGLNAMYALWMIISLLRGLELQNCGCFGVFFPQPLRWYSPIEDLALVALCYVLFRLAANPDLDTSTATA